MFNAFTSARNSRMSASTRSKPRSMRRAKSSRRSSVHVVLTGSTDKEYRWRPHIWRAKCDKSVQVDRVHAGPQLVGVEQAVGDRGGAVGDRRAEAEFERAV